MQEHEFFGVLNNFHAIGSFSLSLVFYYFVFSELSVQIVWTQILKFK